MSEADLHKRGAGHCIRQADIALAAAEQAQRDAQDTSRIIHNHESSMPHLERASFNQSIDAATIFDISRPDIEFRRGIWEISPKLVDEKALFVSTDFYIIGISIVFNAYRYIEEIRRFHYRYRSDSQPDC